MVALDDMPPPVADRSREVVFQEIQQAVDSVTTLPEDAEEHPADEQRFPEALDAVRVAVVCAHCQSFE